MITHNQQFLEPAIDSNGGNPSIAPWAYAAVYTGPFALLIPFFFLIPLTCGLLAIRSIRRNPMLVGTGRAVFGIIWGVIGLLVSAFSIVLILNQK